MLSPPSPATAASIIHTPATASISTSSASPASPTRPSRLRGLSYLRSYTRDHLHPASSPVERPAHLSRSTSSPGSSEGGGGSTLRPAGTRDSRTQDAQRIAEPATIHTGESGWVPTVQGRSGLSRDSPQPTSTNTESASATTDPVIGIAAMTRSRAATALGPTSSAPSTGSATNGARRQSAVEQSAVASNLHVTNPSGSDAAVSSSAAAPAKDQLPTIRFIPHLEARSASTRPSLQFTALSRQLTNQTTVVRVGRYSERDNASPEPNTLPVGFKSKVVSRRHCELWCTSGQWYIKDVKSSSGTFLNHVRLSAPGQESRPFPVNDGDVVQLGIDFKGGEEVIFRCVKIRIECNRGWQKSLNTYNTTAHKRLLRNAGVRSKNRDSDAASVNSSECSICLNPVAPCQALFVAPCSHVWHYKCVRNLIHGASWPNFLCPNCRFVADLEADVEPPEADEAQDFFEEGEGEEEEDLVNGGDEAGNSREHVESSSTDEQRDAPDNDSSASNEASHRLKQSASERRNRPGPGNRNITDEELAGLLDQTSLHRAHNQGKQQISSGEGSTSSLNNDENASPANATSKSRQSSSQKATAQQPSTPTVSQPQPIPSSSTSSSRQLQHSRNPSSTDLLHARSATPTSHTQFALAAGVLSVSDGPMTPRNDAGPFVFDGSGGRGDAVGGIERRRDDEDDEE